MGHGSSTTKKPKADVLADDYAVDLPEPEDDDGAGRFLPSKQTARETRNALLEKILDDERECEILEDFLHSEYKVELLYFLRACAKFEATVRRCLVIEAGDTPTSAAKCRNPHLIGRGREIWERHERRRPRAPAAAAVARGPPRAV